MDTSPSKDSTQIVLKGSAAVVQGLLVLGTAIPIIGQFAVALQKAVEVINQASRNEDARVRLHDHAVDISDGLLPHITVFDNGLNKLINIDSQKQFYTKVMSATDTKLVTQVDIYINTLLSDRKDRLIDLVTINTNHKVTIIAEVRKNHANIEVN